MKKLVTVIVVLAIGCTYYFYYTVVQGFGNAVLKTSKSIYEIKKDLQTDSINLIDSIKHNKPL